MQSIKIILLSTLFCLTTPYISFSTTLPHTFSPLKSSPPKMSPKEELSLLGSVLSLGLGIILLVKGIMLTQKGTAGSLLSGVLLKAVAVTLLILSLACLIGFFIHWNRRKRQRHSLSYSKPRTQPPTTVHASRIL